MATVDLEALRDELVAAGFEADLYTDAGPDDDFVSFGPFAVYADGTAEQNEWIEQHEWPAVLIIARHLSAGDAARTEEGETIANKAGGGVGVCRICGADIWASEGDTCTKPCTP